MSEKAKTTNNYDDEWSAAEPIEGAPDFLKQCADNDMHYLVKTRRATFKLKELPHGKVEQVRKRNKTSTEILLSESIIGKDGVDKTFGELDIREWPGGTVTRLNVALTYIYEADNFLGGSEE